MVNDFFIETDSSLMITSLSKKAADFFMMHPNALLKKDLNQVLNFNGSDIKLTNEANSYSGKIMQNKNGCKMEFFIESEKLYTDSGISLAFNFKEVLDEKISVVANSHVSNKISSIIANTEFNENNIYSLISNIINSHPGKNHFKKYDSHSGEFKYIITNKNTDDLFGVSSIKLKGQTDKSLESGIMSNRWEEGFSSYLYNFDYKTLMENSPLIAEVEKPYLDANGKVVTQSLTKVPVFDNQNPFGIITFATDLNKFKDIDQLKLMYLNLYPNDKKLAIMKLQDHIGISKYIQYEDYLTETEFDIFIKLHIYKSSYELANAFFVAPKTIYNHMSGIKSKLGLKKNEIINLSYFMHNSLVA